MAASQSLRTTMATSLGGLFVSDFSNFTKTCPYCGQRLKIRKGTLTAVNPPQTVFAGYYECQCEGAVQARKAKAEADKQRLEDSYTWYKRHQIQLAEEAAGIPPRYLNAESDLAKDVVKDLREGKWVYLHGPVGIGKTTCLAAAARQLIVEGEQPVMIPMWRIINEVEDMIRTGSRQEVSPIDKYARVPFLLLDDLGKEQPNAFVLPKIFALIDTRYSNDLPTAITTQYDHNALIDRFAAKGDRDTAQAIVDRLHDGADVMNASDSENKRKPANER